MLVRDLPLDITYTSIDLGPNVEDTAEYVAMTSGFRPIYLDLVYLRLEKVQHAMSTFGV